MILLFRSDPYQQHCSATVIGAQAGAVQLDRTVFYPMGGGQPGDTGLFRQGSASWPVLGTTKGAEPDTVVHALDATAEMPLVGSAVEAALDWPRRYGHMRMHTALHLLCAAVTGDVTGGQIGAARSRLDFNLPSGVLDREAIAARLNELVDAALPVRTLWISDEELADRPELVRTMSVKPPTGSGRVRLVAIGPEDAPIDLQPCGGTHVANTREIGRLVVGKIENKGKQNRRIGLELAMPETGPG